MIIDEIAARTIKPKYLYHNVSPEVVHKAVLAYNAGMDHLNGERIVAVFNDSDKERYSLGAILTDRRLIQRHDKKYNSIPYATMSGPIKTSGGAVANATIEVVNEGTPVKMTTLSNKHIEKFLNEVITLPTNQRTGEAPKPQLPSDGRLQAILASISGAEANGLYDKKVANILTHQVMLMQATLKYGRGMVGDQWMIFLSQADLRAMLGGMFGEAIKEETDEQGDIVTYFNLKNKGQGRAKAAASTAAGLATMAVLGVGWVSVPGRTISELATRISNRGMFSGFKLFANYKGTYIPAGGIFEGGIGPSFFQGVSKTLFKIEAQILLSQALFGPASPYVTLSPDNRAAVQQQVNLTTNQAFDIERLFFSKS